jgi:hypothetical protein
MSDSFQSYVFRKKRFDDAGTFGRVKDWLHDEKVISDEGAPDEGAYRPSVGAVSILVTDDHHWRGLAANGVLFETGRIIEASTELEWACCPDCNNTFPVDSEAFSVIGNALSSYAEDGSGEFLCPHCRREQHLLHWDFGHGLAVGDAKVTFWNWPEHVPDLERRFFELSGMWCTKVWGKL